MYRVVKRDGKIVDFNISKISEAIRKAFEAQNRQYNDDIIDSSSKPATPTWRNATYFTENKEKKYVT